MKIVGIVLLAFTITFLAWSWNFKSTGLEIIPNSDPVSAWYAAMQYQYEHDLPSIEYSVIETTGASNNWLGTPINGYVVVWNHATYDDLRKNMFVIYRWPDGRLINHRLRVKTADGWIAEGDGNSDSDPFKVTSENLYGVVVNNLLWSY